MVAEPPPRLGIDCSAYFPVLLLLDFRDSYVLYEVQELELEKQQNEIYLPDCLYAVACVGLSCTGCNNLVVSCLVGCAVKEESLNPKLPLFSTNFTPIPMFTDVEVDGLYVYCLFIYSRRYLCCL